MSKLISKLAIALGLSFNLFVVVSIREPGAAQSRDDKKEGTARTGAIRLSPLGYKPAQVTPASELGAKFYSESHCSACHSIGNDGTSIGPKLDAIGAHRNADFLIARLGDTPANIAEYARLTGQDAQKLPPHLRLSKDMVDSVVAYLMTLPEPVGGYAVSRHHGAIAEKPLVKPEFQPDKKSFSSESSKRLYNKFACAQCHQIQQVGGYIGPSLDGIGSLHSREFIAGQVSDAQAEAITTDKFFEIVPTSMPQFNATPEEAKQVADYLMTLPPLER